MFTLSFVAPLLSAHNGSASQEKRTARSTFFAQPFLTGLRSTHRKFFNLTFYF